MFQNADTLYDWVQILFAERGHFVLLYAYKTSKGIKYIKYQIMTDQKRTYIEKSSKYYK